MNLNLKKAAMFGLDARIALAIFGALSVISGAALYSVIQQAKATALLSDMQEVGKAWEQLYLDTGVKHFPESTDVNWFEIRGLVEDLGYDNWKGPYLQYKTTSCGEVICLDHPLYHKVSLFKLAEKATWGDTVAGYNAGYCLSGEECYLWAVIGGIQDKSIVNKIDLLVDGTLSATTGNFKWHYTDDDYKYRAYLKITHADNPND